MLAAGEDSDSNLEPAPEGQGKPMQQRHRPSSGQGIALAAGLLGKRKGRRHSCMKSSFCLS